MCWAKKGEPGGWSGCVLCARGFLCATRSFGDLTMKTLLKILLAGFLLVVILIVVGVVLIFRSVNTLAEKGIEAGGQKVLGVDVDAEAVKVSLFGGTFAMGGLTIDNPEGYPSPHFMKLPASSVAVDLSTVQGEVITIPELKIGTIDAYLDGTGGTANYKAILANVKKDESDDTPPADPGEEGPKFVITSLVLDGANVKVTGFPGMKELTGDVTVDVPTIELKDVGSAEPLETGELISLIVKTVLSTAVANGGGILPADLMSGLKGQLSELTGLDAMGITAIGDVGELQGKLTEKAQEKLDEVKDEAEEKIKDTIGNLLGGDKDKKDDDGTP